MFCYCRLLRHVLSTKRINIRTDPFNLRFTSSSHLTEFLSKENLSQEAGASWEVLRDVRKFQSIWRRQRDSKSLQTHMTSKLLQNERAPSYIISFLRLAHDHESYSLDQINSVLFVLNKSIQDSVFNFSPSIVEKTEALNTILQYRNYPLLQLVCSVFKISEKTDCIKEFISGLVKEQKIIEAVLCIGAFNLQHEFDVEEIIFDLLWEWNIHSLMPCLANQPDLQLQIAKRLDTLLLIKKAKSDDIGLSVNSKKAYKTLNTFVNVFKIPAVKCPNLCYIRGRAALNLLIKRRAEQSITENTWEEMVMSVIENSPQLKEHLIFKLLVRNDQKTALMMVDKLDMHDFDIDKLKGSIKVDENAVDMADIGDDVTEILDASIKTGSDSCLTFALKSSDITFIDSEEKFTEFIKDVTENYKIMGIDSEWKPHFGLSEERLSLIQLAVHDKVYILDMLSLTNCLKMEHWDMLMDRIFGNPKIIKLGCGIMADVQMIVSINMGTKGKTIRFAHILDMAIFYEKLLEVYPDQMDFVPVKGNNTIGLSKLCEIILGKPLNKEERLCDWEKRPLTDSQLEYAALDAHCLIQIFDKLKEEAVKKDMNFEHQAKLAIHLTNRLWKPKKRLKGVKNERGLEIQKPMPIHEFRVAVDSALESYGKQLRQLGADVLILNDSDTPSTAVEISKSQQRILICSEVMWRKVENEVRQGFCFKPVNKFGDHASISYILQKFNIVMRAKNILSHCVVCQSEEGIHLSPEDITFLQKQDTNDQGTRIDTDEKGHNVKKILDLVKSGITIKLHDPNSHSRGGLQNSRSFLCTKCGTLQ